ncbi:MAG: DUF2894 domain-containing protein [Burkholderiales bacterium]|jgi:hypothetical protein|nr:DUF2894 domain-containing protein [Burkholderiales bacterium]
MSADAAGKAGRDPLAAVEVWGAPGAKSVDPVGVGVIEALARRAAAQQGEVRRLLMRRVEELRNEHAAAKPTNQADQALDEPAVRRCALAGLSDLVDRLGRSPVSSVLSTQPRPGMARQTDASITGPLSRVAPPPPLKAVVVFKGTWSRLRAEHRLRQALAQVPAMAGPLNSSHLVNCALQAMRDVSPEYLDAFMSHIDTLQWLEQASGAGDLTARPMTPTEGRRRPGAREVRKA